MQLIRPDPVELRAKAELYFFAKPITELRGADPGEVGTAKDADYDPPTKFEFPRFMPVLTGDGFWTLDA